MSGRTAMKHAVEIGWRWDALLLFDPPNVPPPDIRPCEVMAAFEKRLTAWARGRRRRFTRRGTSRRIPPVARDSALGARRARIDGAFGAAPKPGRRRLRTRLRSGKRGGDLCAGDDAQSVARSLSIRRPGQADRLRSEHERRAGNGPGEPGAGCRGRLRLQLRRRYRTSSADRKAARLRTPHRRFPGEMHRLA